jgi:hypothetical protein
MSLPGRWTDDVPSVRSPSPPLKQPPKTQRQFQQSNYSDPAVTQFVNEHFSELDDLQNVGQLISSLDEQQAVITAEACSLILSLIGGRLVNQRLD